MHLEHRSRNQHGSIQFRVRSSSARIVNIAVVLRARRERFAVVNDSVRIARAHFAIDQLEADFENPIRIGSESKFWREL
jgi:hypothetical protein